MSELKVDKISPDTATSLTVGETGDTVTVPSGATLDVSNATANLPATITVASELKTNKLSPASGTTFTMGDSGDAFTISSGATITNNGTATGFLGAFTLISSTTFTNQASYEITTNLDSTYDVYMFKFINMNPATDNIKFTFNGSSDAGSSYNVVKTTTAFTAQHEPSGGEYTTLTYSGAEDLQQSANYQTLAWGIGNAASQSMSGEMYLFQPSSTTFVKHWYMRGPQTYYSSYVIDGYYAGFFDTTSAINALNFKMSSGNMDGTIQMWGL